MDEVPDSSWFTNRNPVRPLTADEIARGPNESDGPSPDGPWEVIKCKSEGIAPGLWIRDSKNDVYILKFDSRTFPELSTAADVISSKILWAAGYNVPENSIVTFPAAILKVDPGSQCLDLATLPRTTNGLLRAMASKLLDGTPKGPFSYEGTRKDDPNDVIPHQQRRELRGLRMIAAFINHTDVKSQNTLDCYVTENGNSFLKHYLIDFGSSLGSSTYVPKSPTEGREYLLDLKSILTGLVSFGLYPRHDDGFIEYPSIGRLGGMTLNPMGWKPNFPVVPFAMMTKRDGYWAAKIVASFTDEQIEAAVAAGRYSNAPAAQALSGILEARRDRIAVYWFRRVAPLERFRFENNQLVFDDLALKYRYDPDTNVRYRLEHMAPQQIRVTRLSKNWPDLSVTVTFREENGSPVVVAVQR